jgi:hypothetical protein
MGAEVSFTGRGTIKELYLAKVETYRCEESREYESNEVSDE